MSGPIVRGLTSIVSPGNATKVTVDQFGRVTTLGSLGPADIPDAIISAPLSSARNVIAAATTTIDLLTLKSTDDNTTKSALRVLASDGSTVVSSIGATGAITGTTGY